MKATLIEYMGSDLAVVNAARVSFGKKSGWEYKDEEFDLADRDKKLIGYLSEHGHYSPFGHCFASFHIKAPIFVCRQLVKHEYLRMNEISRRYVDSEPEFYFPDIWRGKSKDKKQGSEGVIEDGRTIGDWLRSSCSDSVDLYKSILGRGVAPEQARMVLPLNTYTEWYWSGSLDAFANMYNLRTSPDSQYETSLIAKEIGQELTNIFPHSWKALTNG